MASSWTSLVAQMVTAASLEGVASSKINHLSRVRFHAEVWTMAEEFENAALKRHIEHFIYSSADAGLSGAEIAQDIEAIFLPDYAIEVSFPAGGAMGDIVVLIAAKTTIDVPTLLLPSKTAA